MRHGRRRGSTRRARLVASGAAALASIGLVYAPTSIAATRPPSVVPAGLTASVADAHFVVHYDPASTSATQASEILGWGATSYQKEVVDLGLPAPLDDGDGKTDVYIYKTSGGELGTAHPDSGGDQTSGWMQIDSDYPSLTTFGHELMHLVEFGLYARGSAEHWLDEPIADWAASQVAGRGSNALLFGNPETPIDCLGPGYYGPECHGDPFGYGRWPFYEFLTERYGAGILTSVYQHEAALGASDHAPHGLAALEAALGDRGASLSGAFQGFVEAAVSGDFTLLGLRGLRPAARLEPTGAGAHDLPTRAATVDHLAATYVEYKGPAGAPCDAATLHVDVTLPAALATQPVLNVLGDSLPPYRLAVNAGHATGDIPWQTCASREGELALPNPTLRDGASFSVAASLSVPSAPSPPSRPPTPEAPPFGGVMLATRTAKVGRKGVVSIALACPGDSAGSCTGTLTLTAKARARRIRAARAAKTLRIASAHFSIAPARTMPVRLRLSGAGRRLLKGHRSLRVTATAVAYNDTANASTVAAITLRPQKPAARR